MSVAWPARFTSNTDEWESPIDLFTALDREFHFTLDVCARSDNTKCERYLTKEDDALSVAWRGVCWMNPPYGRTIGDWMKKAYLSALDGCTVVCLVPARTDTNWWHDYAMNGEIRFIRGRLRFNNYPSNAPFASAIVVLHPHKDPQPLMRQTSFTACSTIVTNEGG